MFFRCRRIASFDNDADWDVGLGGILGDGAGESFAVGLAEGGGAPGVLRLPCRVQSGVYGLDGSGRGFGGEHVIEPSSGGRENEANGGEFEAAENFVGEESAREAAAH